MNFHMIEISYLWQGAVGAIALVDGVSAQFFVLKASMFSSCIPIFGLFTEGFELNTQMFESGIWRFDLLVSNSKINTQNLRGKLRM